MRNAQLTLDASYDEMTDFLQQNGASSFREASALEEALFRAHIAVREARRDEGRRPGELSDDGEFYTLCH